MSETETAWMLVEKLSNSHTRITGRMIKSGEKIPPVKTEKVWVEGEVVWRGSGNVTIDTGEERFTQDDSKVYGSRPPDKQHKKDPLTNTTP